MHRQMVDRFRGVFGVTFGASMPHASLDLPNSVELRVLAINRVLANTLLDVISGMTNSDVVTLSDPSQHFQRNHRLLVFGFIPTRRNNGNRVLLKKRLAKDKVTGRGDCYRH